MANHNNLIAIGIISVIMVSLFFLVRVALNDAPYLMFTTLPRLTAFVFIHIFIISMMIWFTRLTQLYEYVRWGFVLSGSVALTITSVQIYVAYLRCHAKNGQYNIKTLQPIQLAYLNCYFIVYMYSLISSFLSGLYYCCTKCLIKYRSYKIKKAVKQSIFGTQYTSDLDNFQCAICISELEPQDQLLKIKCGHVFHRECLLQWIKLNQTCPTCRFNVFQQLNPHNGPLAALI